MGPRHGWVRLTRTGVFALVCLALAAGAHALAGGGLPPVGVLLLAALPVWFASFWLTSRRVGARSLVFALGGGQLALHVFFHATARTVVGAGSPGSLLGSTGALGSGGSVAGAMPGHGAHAAHALAHATAVPAATAATGTTGAGAGLEALSTGLSPAMLLAHAAATLVCALVMTHAEDAVWRLVRPLLATPCAGPLAVRVALWGVHPAPRPLTGRWCTPGWTLRGPPVGVAPRS